MYAVRFSEGKIEVQEVRPPSGDGVRVRVRSVGICGSDVHMLDKGFPMAAIPGHEFAGLLDDGTPVGIEPIAPCGKCVPCAQGHYNLCELGPRILVGVGLDGGMAEEALIPERCLVPLPATLDAKDACLIEPMAVALHGLHKAGLEGGMRVAVVGGGTIGLCAVAGAVFGSAEVGLAARHPHQVQAGERLGAQAISGSYDLVVECAGSASALDEAIRLCRPNGRMLILGTYWDGVAFPHFAVAQKDLTIYSTLMYACCGTSRDCDSAAALLAARPEIAEVLITHRFPLVEAAQAFDVARDRKSGAIKVVLEP